MKNPKEEPKQEFCEYIKEVGCIKDICTCNTGPKQETLEEFAERLCPNKQIEYDMIIEGAKWQQERMYSEEEVLELLKKFDYYPTMYKGTTESEIKEWFEQFKKR